MLRFKASNRRYTCKFLNILRFPVFGSSGISNPHIEFPEGMRDLSGGVVFRLRVPKAQRRGEVLHFQGSGQVLPPNFPRGYEGRAGGKSTHGPCATAYWFFFRLVRDLRAEPKIRSQDQPNACNTWAKCSSGLTLGKTALILPSGSMTNVVRSVPM